MPRLSLAAAQPLVLNGSRWWVQLKFVENPQSHRAPLGFHLGSDLLRAGILNCPRAQSSIRVHMCGLGTATYDVGAWQAGIS